MKRETFNPKNTFQKFLLATGGAISVWAGAAAPVLIGGAALSVDASRMYNLDQELQSASDALAKAASAELDQRPDSILRSLRAAHNLVRNDQKFADTGLSDVTIDRIDFLHSVPSQDFQTINSTHITTDPSQARFVSITVTPKNITTLFPPNLVSGLTRINLSANAVSGRSQSVCGIAPVFICNPYEGTELSIYEALDDPSERRRQVKLVTPGGGNAQFGPGNFGYLDMLENGGANALRDAIAIDVPPICMSSSSGVDLRPGQISSVRHAINTRFDIYEADFRKARTDPQYAPAENVIKGTLPRGRDACRQRTNDSAQGLPRDNCHLTNNCAENNGRIGDGDWDFMSYMRVNHNNLNHLTLEGINYRLDFEANRFFPNITPSRYALYRWEIDSNLIPGEQTYGPNSGPEEGRPQCHATGPSTQVEDRRILHAAILNCGALDEAGIRLSGRAENLPVETFVKIFITEPMLEDRTLFGEIIGTIDLDDNVARERVALTR